MAHTAPGMRADALANRERIVSAAQVLFSERGLDVEIGEIAERAGVGVGTLYRHYANRDDLLRAIVDKAFVDAGAHMQKALAIEDPIEALRALPQAALAIHRQLGPVFDVLHDQRVSKLFKEWRQCAEHVPEPLAAALAMLGELYDRGVRTGAFRSDLDREIVASTLMASFGATFKFRPGDRPLEDLADSLSDFYVAILARQ